MTTPLPAWLATGTVRGKSYEVGSDTAADVDTLPDTRYPVGATLKFVPTVPYLVVPDPTARAVVYLDPVTAVINDSGDPVTQAGDVLQLVANIDQPLNDQDWYWAVTASIGTTRYAPFRLDVTASVDNYLSDQIPIPAASPSSLIVRGPAGDDGPPGLGLVAGGTTGQVLSKNSSTDYDTTWTSGIPAPDARLADVDGRVAQFRDPWDQNNPARSFQVTWDDVGPKITTPGAVPPEATSFGQTLVADEFAVVDQQGHRHFRLGADGIMHVYEQRRLVESADSMSGFSTVRAEDKNLAAALGRPVLNIGIGGSLQSWLDAAYGARPAKVTVSAGRSSGLAVNYGTIPSTGSVTLTISPELGSDNAYSEVIVCGVRGRWTPTTLPGSPDPLSASDPGSISSNYCTGTFDRYDQGGHPVQVPDGSPMWVITDPDSGTLWRRHWWIINPSRHDFRKRYQKLTAAGSAGSLVLGTGLVSTGSIAWNPTAPTPIAVTFATNDQVTFATAHGLAAGDPVQFGTVTGAAPIVAGAVYFVKTVVSSTIVTLTANQAGASGVQVDITATGSSTTATTAEAVFCRQVYVALAAAYAFTGTVNILTGIAGGTSTAGQIEIDWSSSDTPVSLAIVSTTTMTATIGHPRNGIEDTVAGVAAQLDMLSSDARDHSFVTDLAPFPGEEDNATGVGTAATKFRVQLDACNDALAEAFGSRFYPLWSLMRSADVITRAGGTVTGADTTAITVTRTTPPTLLDQGGGSTNGGHPGPLGAIARRLLIADLFAAMPLDWTEAA